MPFEIRRSDCAIPQRLKLSKMASLGGILASVLVSAVKTNLCTPIDKSRDLFADLLFSFS